MEERLRELMDALGKMPWRTDDAFSPDDYIELKRLIDELLKKASGSTFKSRVKLKSEMDPKFEDLISMIRKSIGDLSFGKRSDMYGEVRAAIAALLGKVIQAENSRDAYVWTRAVGNLLAISKSGHDLLKEMDWFGIDSFDRA